MVGTLDSKDDQDALQDDPRVQYAEPGYLLFVRERTLVAQKFDLASLTWKASRCRSARASAPADVGLASFSVSRNGVLVFRGGELAGTRLVWVDRSGKETPVLDAPADYRDTSLSPRRHASRVRRRRRREHPRRYLDPRPGARRVVALHLRRRGRDRPAMVARRPPHRLHIARERARRSVRRKTRPAHARPSRCWYRRKRSMSPTGHATAGTSCSPVEAALEKPGGTPGRCRSMATGSRSRSATPSSTRCGRRSRPTAKYIAYQSNESGRAEIYVHEFPEARNKWQVSTEGGTQPHWRGDGRELFYRAGTSLMAVPVQAGATFSRWHARAIVRDAVCGRHCARALPCRRPMASASSCSRRSRATRSSRRRWC